MKIMLINPTAELIEKSKKLKTFLTPILPLGIASIAAVLEREGIEVKIIDQFANKMTNREVLGEIKRYNPQIIGFSCLTQVINNVKNLVHEIRSFSKALIVLGNIHPTLFNKELLKERIADVVVRGEGEITTLELVEAIQKKVRLHEIKGISFREENSIFHNPDRPLIEDLDTLPYPAWHLFEISCYRQTPQAIIHNELGMPISASRGCPYRCIFCAQDKIYPKPRYRKSEEIVKEMEYMHEKFNVKYFGFFDANFPFSIESGLEFCEALIHSGLHKKIKWCTETRVDLVNEELLVMMNKAGVHLIMFGFESGNQTILNQTNKGTTLRQAREAMKAVKKLKIYTLGLFMLGLPGETRSTCEDTIKFAKELDCDVTKFNLAVPYPGSRFFEEFSKGKNYISAPEKFTSWYDWSDEGGELVYTPEGISSRELVGLQRRAMFEFYVRPKIIINYLKHNKSSLKNILYGAYILFSKYLSTKIFSRMTAK